MTRYISPTGQAGIAARKRFYLRPPAKDAVLTMYPCPRASIFGSTTAFAQRRFKPQSERDDTDAHREFVQAWRNAKVLEFESIASGDPELATMAARHARNIWHRRVWNHDAR